MAVVVALMLLPALADAQSRRPRPGRWTVPELDPSAAGAVVLLLAGGGVLLARRRR